jgi:4-amino-4-deoxy-L-arabinose transferase-like glycosyltransferase
MKGNKQKLFWGIMILIGLANTLQAIFTELIYDEAYYWYFSKQLDWGYFDHPPMVAAMIALGNLFFKGTLGVRIIGVFSTLGAYVLIWNTVSKTHKKHHIGAFFVLLSSMTLLNAYGFFTLPGYAATLFYSLTFLSTEVIF